MILVDSGPLIAAAIVEQKHHRACVDLFTGLGLAGRRLLVPHTVVAETAYMLHRYAGARAESAFVRSPVVGQALDQVDQLITALGHASV